MYKQIIKQIGSLLKASFILNVKIHELNQINKELKNYEKFKQKALTSANTAKRLLEEYNKKWEN